MRDVILTVEGNTVGVIAASQDPSDSSFTEAAARSWTETRVPRSQSVCARARSPAAGRAVPSVPALRVRVRVRVRARVRASGEESRERIGRRKGASLGVAPRSMRLEDGLFAQRNLSSSTLRCAMRC